MIRFYPLFSSFLFVLLFHSNGTAQLSEILDKPMYQINGEGFDERVKIDPETAERIYWVIETDRDEKYNRPWNDSVEIGHFNEQLAFVLSCKRLKELHVAIIDEVVHFPDNLKRIRELDSLKILTLYFDLLVTTIDMEVILTDEIEEFSYRPFNLSFLRDMNALEIFATNWNAEVHDPDALLELTELTYAQVPVASLQPDFFNLPKLQYVQCGNQLKLRWHKNDRKLKPWYDEVEFEGLFFDGTEQLREMELESAERKKPIDWTNAFIQLNNAGDTLFHLQGTGKHYSLDFLKESDGCEGHSARYQLERNGDRFTTTVINNSECSRVSSTQIIEGDTCMSIHYTRDYTWKDQPIKCQITDHYVNGKRTGNYDLLDNGILYTRRTYFQDSLVRKFPDDYTEVYVPMFELLKKSNPKVRLFYKGGQLENDKIRYMEWGPSRMNYNPTDYQLFMEVNDTIPHGRTYATNNSGDTVLIIHFENGVRNGYFYHEYKADRGRGTTCTESIFYSNGNQLYGTTDDGTYIRTFDHREGAKNIYTLTLKSTGMLLQQSFYHAETNEYEYISYHQKTGELVQSKRVKKDR